MNKNYSILRKEEYKILSNLKVDGSILDLGGSKNSGYHQLLKGSHKITTVNIDERYGCDLIFDIEKEFPLNDNFYDNVLSVNTLEHIFNFNNVISESYRVLKKNGKIILFTPFIFRIHGSPDDYFRYTKSALKKILQENDFKDIVILEMGFGLFSLIFQIIGGAVPIIFLRNFIKNSSIGLDKFLFKVSKKYKKLSKKIPIGYFVSALKK